MQMYDDAATTLNISAMRNAEIWRYLLQDAAGSAMAGQCWLVLDAHSQPAGYFRIMFHGFGKGLIVSETSRHSQDISLVMLHHLKALAREHDKPSIRFNLPLSNDLLRTAQGCGADNTGTYAWQMLVVDAARLLRKITPVLERRIAASSFNSLTQRLIINLYREAFELRFEAGKLLAVKALGFSDQWGIRLPPPLFAPLVLGYRSPADLSACYHDVQVLKEAKPLVDVLFPGMDSFIYTIY
jgi:hypothetical protein